MGISTPKKPFNLAEFLAVKAKPQAMRRNPRYRAPSLRDDDQTESAAEPAAAGIVSARD
jgi:hypothetical protein